MDPLALPLCSYCGQSPSRPDDSYCCDGCRTLAEFSNSPRENLASDASAEDPVLIQTFGKRRGDDIRFNCHVDALACEACLQGLVRLRDLIPEMSELRWDRRRSVLNFGFPVGSERPSRAFTLLQRFGLSPRWSSDDGGAEDSRQKERTLRLGLTGALAGNIMLFAIPIYAGLEGTLARVFEWIQFMLFIPVFLWSAIPFYKTAWTSLRMRRLSVDLPLTIAFVGGSTASIAALAQGGGDLYFDSLAGFLFLILWSRSLLENSLSKSTAPPRLESFLDRAVFSVRRNDTLETVSWQDIAIGDRLIISAGERIPVDGRLVGNAVEIESAWMTGEKTPHWRLRGSLIQAGTRLLSSRAEIEVTTPAEKTEFADLIRQLDIGGEKLQAGPEARLGSLLVLTCLLAALGLFAFGHTLGLDEVLRRSVALLIVACPCAVSFAVPLARAKANRLALKKGFWIKDSQVWPRLTNVRRLAFDKTGTLTGGLFTSVPHAPMLDDHWKKIILSLENVSRHPIAESLRRMWGPLPLLPVENGREIPGVGVEGRIGNSSYILVGSENDRGYLQLDLIRDGARTVEVLLQDDASAAAETILHRLRRKYELFIVSGDREQRVFDFGQRYGFDHSRVFGGLSPHEKSKVLDEISPDLYFGDGTNDLPALKRAPVSVAVKAAAIEAQTASDIVMFDADLDRFEDLLEIATETRTLNHRNLFLALAYNLVAGTAALSGLIHPLGAAILMPIASLTLLGSTLWGTAALRRMEKKA